MDLPFLNSPSFDLVFKMYLFLRENLQKPWEISGPVRDGGRVRKAALAEAEPTSQPNGAEERELVQGREDRPRLLQPVPFFSLEIRARGLREVSLTLESNDKD